MTENWKDVEGYDGQYQVSDLGHVRSRKYGYWRPSRLTETQGHQVVGLYKDLKMRLWLVHRLVAIAFVPNPDGKRIVVNKDGDQTNNVPANLVWKTYSDIHPRRAQ